MFISPTQVGASPKRWQTCFFAATPTKEQWAAGNAALGEDVTENERGNVQYCRSDCAWSLVGSTVEAASFETLSVRPSLDGSAGGNWHGFITNGEIVGGI